MPTQSRFVVQEMSLRYDANLSRSARQLFPPSVVRGSTGSPPPAPVPGARS